MALPPEPDPDVHNPMGVLTGLSKWVATEIPRRQGRALTYFSQNPAAEAVPVTNLPIGDLKIPCKPKYNRRELQLLQCPCSVRNIPGFVLIQKEMSTRVKIITE